MVGNSNIEGLLTIALSRPIYRNRGVNEGKEAYIQNLVFSPSGKFGGSPSLRGAVLMSASAHLSAFLLGQLNFNLDMTLEYVLLQCMGRVLSLPLYPWTSYAEITM